jgi:N utilization substance protein A
MSDLTNAIKQICEEKGLSYDSVLVTIESALAAAFRKDFGEKNQNIVVTFDPDTASSKVYDVKTVVEDMPEVEEEEENVEVEEVKEDKKKEKKTTKKKEEETVLAEVVEGEEVEERKFNPKTEIQISDAKLIKKTAKIDSEIKTKLEIPADFGRMAAQTAKQVIIQRLREAERETIFKDFKDKEHEVVGGVIQRQEGRVILVDLGKSVGILTMDEQISGERYNPGDRIKVYVKEVRMGSKGPEIILSRTSEEILRKVFYLEIPEISNGLIEIKSVAREAGSRSKVAVSTDSENVDPIGSCVGQRGARIQTVISELGGRR